MRLFLTFCVGLALTAAPAVVHANDRALAQALFDEARQLMAAGKFAQACPKLEASNAADPALGTLLNLAGCYEHVGKTASAWTLYNQVATSAGAGARATFARDKAKALEPTLARLTIRAPHDRTVTRDGAAIPSVVFGIAVPVDPGLHVVAAGAFRRTVDVTTGANVVVTVPP